MYVSVNKGVWGARGEKCSLRGMNRVLVVVGVSFGGAVC